jgi:hypothetical protein
MFLILELMGQQLMVVIILVLILSLKSTDNLINSTNCIPNVNLNTFLPMTHSNGILMTSQLQRANSNSYTPTQPGYYQVRW